MTRSPSLPFVLFPLAGAAALLGFEPFGLFPAGWICLVPLLAAAPVTAWYRRLLEGYAFGLAFYGAGLSWLPASIGAFLGWSAVWSVAMYAFIVGFLALFPAAFRLLLGHVARPLLRLLVVAPALWVALEWLRFNAWGGLPWLNVAATQIDGPLAAWLPVLGEAGVTFLVVLCNGLVLLLAHRAWGMRPESGMARLPGLPAIRVLTGLLVLATAALAPLDWTRPTGPEWEFGLVQADVPARQHFTEVQRTAIGERYRELVDRVAHADLTILPESATRLRAVDWRERFGTPVAGTAYLAGSLEPTPNGRRYNSVFLFSGESVSVYRKERLVPVAEHRPAWLGHWLDPEGNLPDATLAGAITDPLPWRDTALGLAICWEIRFSGLMVQRVRKGAGVLVNPANESWLQSRVARRRLLAVARVRAAEQGRMLVRVVNGGISAVIDADGAIVAEFPDEPPLATTVAVRAHAGMTPGSDYRAGTLLELASFVLVTMAMAGSASARVNSRPYGSGDVEGP